PWSTVVISNRTCSCAATTRSWFPSMLRRPLAVALCACAAGPAAQAAEWSMQPALRWTIDHDSNRTLTADGRSGEGGVVEANALLAWRTERVSLEAQPALVLQRFTDDAYADSDSHVVAL